MCLVQDGGGGGKGERRLPLKPPLVASARKGCIGGGLIFVGIECHKVNWVWVVVVFCFSFRRSMPLNAPLDPTECKEVNGNGAEEERGVA